MAKQSTLRLLEAIDNAYEKREYVKSQKAKAEYLYMVDTSDAEKAEEEFEKALYDCFNDYLIEKERDERL